MMNLTSTIRATLCTLLRPLVRILLRNSISYPTFAELAKWVYYQVALEEFHLPGRKQTHSRIALLTGLTRKEVLRVSRFAAPADGALTEKQSRATRIIGGWVRDPRFHDRAGRPALLDFDGEGATFGDLVRSFGGDIPPRAVFDELLRLGVVERTDDGRIRLLTPAYVPREGVDEKMSILGTDVADLIATIDHNLPSSAGEPFFQRKVCYGNFPAGELDAFRRFAAGRCQSLLEELDLWLSRHDQADGGTAPASEQRRTGIAIYYFEGPADGENHEQDPS